MPLLDERLTCRVITTDAAIGPDCGRSKPPRLLAAWPSSASSTALLIVTAGRPGPDRQHGEVVAVPAPGHDRVEARAGVAAESSKD
jgi:hypothetical protein